VEVLLWEEAAQMALAIGFQIMLKSLANPLYQWQIGL
jgi:hypothetical protein